MLIQTTHWQLTVTLQLDEWAAAAAATEEDIIICIFFSLISRYGKKKKSWTLEEMEKQKKIPQMNLSLCQFVDLTGFTKDG